MSSLFDDKERLRDFLKVWPEGYLQELTGNFYATHTLVPVSLVEKLQAFAMSSNQISARFLNGPIERKRGKFIDAFRKLSTFLEQEARPLSGEIYSYAPAPVKNLKKRLADGKKQKKIFDGLWSNFIDAYKKFLEAARESLAETTAIAVTKRKTEGAKIHVTLDKYGILRNENRESSVAPKGLAILRYLLQNEGYQPTHQIMTATNRADTQGTRKMIGKMNRKIERDLKIKDIFESNKGAGYRISPRIKIRMTGH